MTQAKAGAFLSMGRLFKTALTSAFAFSAVAGGVLLSGGEAHAACTTGTVDLLPDPAWKGDKKDTYTANGYTGPGACSVGLTGLTSDPFPNNQTFVKVDYNPGLTVTDTLKYTYSSNRPDVPFQQVSLSLTDATPGQIESVTKKIYDTEGGTLLGTLTTNNATVATLNLTDKGFFSSLYIEETISGNGGSITGVTNGFRQTPGPLPILGAGAAFGFSRKLRSRIKAARTA